ncbi:MAG TPA: GNAT family N-acetyltransferase [Candidatus Sulfotelmatobacter sp.]|nr:GNAT family N-acetyltransferase [Candidatus Sulfotelmatobacter sp.]
MSSLTAGTEIRENLSPPAIRRGARISGNKLVLRGVSRSDASFILSLRTDPRKGAYLSRVSTDVEAQEAWIDSYLAGQGQVYFIIEDNTGKEIGTVRLYDAKGTSFCWGSWILAHGAPSTAAIESALIIYRYALEELGFDSAHFAVDKLNRSVWKFHERFGARRVEETAIEYRYEIDKDSIEVALSRYWRYLPDAIVIEPEPK